MPCRACSGTRVLRILKAPTCNLPAKCGDLAPVKRLAKSAPRVWRAFEDAHFAAQLDGPTEIPMKYFTAAIEAALLTSADTDSETLTLSPSLWSAMVERSRYVMARRAGRSTLGPLKTH